MQILEFVKICHMFFTSVHKTKINAEKNCALSVRCGKSPVN